MTADCGMTWAWDVPAPHPSSAHAASIHHGTRARIERGFMSITAYQTAARQQRRPAFLAQKTSRRWVTGVCPVQSLSMTWITASVSVPSV